MGIIKEEEYTSQIKKGRKRNMGVNSKGKGKAGEYSIVNFLNKLSGHNFMKTPSSGAQVGKTNRNKLIAMTKGQVDVFLGDIICPEDTKFRWVIESKNYANIPIHALLQEGKEAKQVFDFIDQLEYDVESLMNLKIESRKHLSFLFLKITRVGEYIIFNEKHWKDIVSKLVIGNYLKFQKKSVIDTYGNKYIMTDCKEFFKANKESLF
jgi:hypothetical protein